MTTPSSNPVIPSRAPAGWDRIVLTGFMGSGKSTAGRLLAAHLGWSFVDLDAAIEQSTGLSVPALFAEHGEPEFRRLETVALAEALLPAQQVIALGGGAPETPACRELIGESERTAVVYLAASFDTLLERCHIQSQEPAARPRPNLADPSKAAARFHLREALYSRLASHVVQTERLTPAQTLQAVLTTLGLYPH